MKHKKPLIKRLTKTFLERLRKRKMTNAEAAAIMEVSETYLSRTVAALQEKEPGLTMIARREANVLATARRQHREKLAKDVKNGRLTLADAAADAVCSERTMSRYVAAYVPPKRASRTAKKA